MIKVGSIVTIKNKESFVFFGCTGEVVSIDIHKRLPLSIKFKDSTSIYSFGVDEIEEGEANG